MRRRTGGQGAEIATADERNPDGRRRASVEDSEDKMGLKTDEQRRDQKIEF